MATYAEMRAALPPIDLSSITFEDEEYDFDAPPTSSSSYRSCSVSSSAVSTSPASALVSASMLPSSPISSVSPLSSTPSSATRKVLEPTDRSTDFFWPMGVRPLELRGPSRIVRFLPNNNGMDEIINGPKGQVIPATRPPMKSPKFEWQPQMTKMHFVCTLCSKLQATDYGTDDWWPMGICQQQGPILEFQAAPTDDGCDQIFIESSGERALVDKPSNKSSKWVGNRA